MVIKLVERKPKQAHSHNDERDGWNILVVPSSCLATRPELLLTSATTASMDLRWRLSLANIHNGMDVATDSRGKRSRKPANFAIRLHKTVLGLAQYPQAYFAATAHPQNPRAPSPQLVATTTSTTRALPREFFSPSLLRSQLFIVDMGTLSEEESDEVSEDDCYY